MTESPDDDETPAPSDRKAETRRRILAAARPVFLRDGFLAANLNEVARAAGVGKGTLYRHFENKGELYLAVLSKGSMNFLDDMKGAVDPSAPVLTQIDQLARFYVDYWRERPEYYRILWAVQNPDLIGPISDAVMTQIRDAFERPLRLLEVLIRSGVERGEVRRCDPWLTANAISICASTLIGYMTGTITAPIERDERAIYEQGLEIVLAGLAPTS